MTLDLGNQRQIEGLTVFGDDSNRTRFYIMPNQPRFRIDPDTKKPVLSSSSTSFWWIGRTARRVADS